MIDVIMKLQRANMKPKGVLYIEHKLQHKAKKNCIYTLTSF